MKKERFHDVLSQGEGALWWKTRRTLRFLLPEFPHRFYEIEGVSGKDMKGLPVAAFASKVVSPPRCLVQYGSGTLRSEEETLIGWVEASFEQRDRLEAVGIDLRFAFFDPSSARWRRCLFSESLADALMPLVHEGRFPHAFEARPSRGELHHRFLQSLGRVGRPPLTLRDYLMPAAHEALQLWEKGSGRNLVRRAIPQKSANLGGEVQ